MEIILLQEYLSNSISLLDLAVANNICTRTLMKRLKILGIRTHYQKMKDEVRHNFFSEIETENQAYWLGFWVADGNISLTGKNHMFSISISQKDEDHLMKIHNLICPYHSLSKTPATYKSNREIRSNPMCCISFCSKQIFADLKKLGYPERKTYESLHLPKIHESLIIHFIRGYFDGDGCISHSVGIRGNGYKYNNANFTIISKTRSILDEIYKKFLQYGIKSSVTKRIRKLKEHYILSVSGIKNIKKLSNLIYKEATIFLPRKKDIFDSF